MAKGGLIVVGGLVVFVWGNTYDEVERHVDEVDQRIFVRAPVRLNTPNGPRQKITNKPKK